MTRQSENSESGKAAKKISDGLFKRGILVGGQHADSARDAETGSRVRNHQAAETKGRWSNRLVIHNKANEAQKGRRR
jgi:hypothetical protein